MLGVNIGIPVPREPFSEYCNALHESQRTKVSNIALNIACICIRFIIHSIAHSFPQQTGFGGLYGTKSKYGDMDITGDGAIEFFTNRIKITSKWPVPSAPEYLAGLEQEEGKKKQGDGEKNVDHANFAGRM